MDKKIIPMIVGTIIVFGLAVIVTFFVLFLSAMSFDAPGSSSNIQNWAIVAAMNTIPLIIIAHTIIGWIVYSKKRYLLAYAITFLPIFLVAAAVFILLNS